MEICILEKKQLEKFYDYLLAEEREPSTIEKYLRDAREFMVWLAGEAVAKERVSAWKEHLKYQRFQPETINGKLSALNKLFRFLGWEDCRVKYLKIQRRLFRSTEKELTKDEYVRLLDTAQDLGRERLALLMETICATGIRVSEVRYITVEAAQVGRAEIALKGKIRTILLPGKLCRKLQKYAKKQKIVSGEIFLTRNGNGLSRRQIWAEMKALCKTARVAPSKVFPHNLRHLFARTFYRIYKDVARLADVLGHSSIETTRIYLVSTGAEHARQLERLGLIS
ncbi:MAG: tyrosine-type recombinase/integrase [Oscillospiraceae bacterium]|nr:tyrosine-type recombinase/integrase [Oscillospiraceae bacterium]